MKDKRVIITKNGPYIVKGNLPLGKEIAEIGGEGEPEKWVKGESYLQEETYSLCRCGSSNNKPFCDGSHLHVHFNDGDESLK